MYMTTYVVGSRFKELSDDNITEVKDELKHYEIEADVMTGVVGVLLLFFILVEIMQVTRDGFINHFTDVWNIIDSVSIVLNVLFLIYMFQNMFGKDIIDIDNLRLIGALASYLLWLKLFYFMRLFKKTASFLTLIL